MSELFKIRATLHCLVEIVESDCEVTKRLKELILKMTVKKRKSRIGADIIERELYKIVGGLHQSFISILY